MSARLLRGKTVETPAEQGDRIRGHTSLSGVPDGSPLVLPEVSIELISYLNHMFPDRLSLVTTLGSVDAASGARAVVEHLVELHKDQQETNHVLRRKIPTDAGATDRSGSAPAPG